MADGTLPSGSLSLHWASGSASARPPDHHLASGPEAVPEPIYPHSYPAVERQPLYPGDEGPKPRRYALGGHDATAQHGSISSAYPPPPSTFSYGRVLPHPNGLTAAATAFPRHSLAPDRPAEPSLDYRWQDEDRRKSLRLTSAPHERSSEHLRAPSWPQPAFPYDTKDILGARGDEPSVSGAYPAVQAPVYHDTLSPSPIPWAPALPVPAQQLPHGSPHASAYLPHAEPASYTDRHDHHSWSLPTSRSMTHPEAELALHGQTAPLGGTGRMALPYPHASTSQNPYPPLQYAVEPLRPVSNHMSSPSFPSGSLPHYSSYAYSPPSQPFLSSTPQTAQLSAFANRSMPPRPEEPTYPVDASTPYIPARHADTVPDCVLQAVEYRRQLGVIDLTGRKREDAPTRRPPTSQSTRRLVDISVSCINCSRPIGRLSLRGGGVENPTGDHPSKYQASFYCAACVVLPPCPSQSQRTADQISGTPSDPYAGECTYLDHLSAAVDRYLGEDPDRNDTRPTPAPFGKMRLGFVAHDAAPESVKKRRTNVVADLEGVLACDVCRRDLGSGQLRLAATGEPVGSTIEVLCSHCDARYLRCSDCGGGGGNKGVGRWRCKEMFPAGRKTCQLAHSRIGTVSEMDYDVWRIDDLRPEDATQLTAECRELFVTYTLGTLAVPDMIESESPLCRSFDEAEKLTVDAWSWFRPMFRPSDPKDNVQRYLALRWVRPMSRKKRGKLKGKAHRDDLDSSPEERRATLAPDASDPGSPRREGKSLTGFILGEYERDKGILHVALTMPTGAGEAYDATTRLMQTLLAKIAADVVVSNSERARAGLPPQPLLHTVWTMHIMKRDSRIMSRLETRRGFVPLEDFLLKFPEVGIENFPPHRPTYLPPEFLRGFTIYAKPVRTEDLPPGYTGPALAAVETVQNSRSPLV